MKVNKLFNFIQRNCLMELWSPYLCLIRQRSNIHPRIVVGTYKNQADYEDQLRSEENMKKPKSTQKHNTTHHQHSDEFVEKEAISEDLRNLKIVTPNPAKMGQFSKMMLNLKSRKFRERHNSCLLEGKFLIQDAMRAGLYVRTIYFSRLQNLEGLPKDILLKTNLVKVTFDEIKNASEVHHQSTGLVAITTKPQERAIRHLKHKRDLANKNVLPLTLICDSVKDPGNLGTLLRTASSAGCHQVLVTTGSCDVWDPKTVRSAAGAHFKMAITSNLYWDEIEETLQKLNTTKIVVSHHNLSSLNASGSQKEDPVAEVLSKEMEVSESKETDLSQSKETINNSETNTPENEIQSEYHHDIKYFDLNGHTVLIIGSEVGGVSKQALLTTSNLSKNDKCEVALAKIPMFEENDCLNASVAGSIIMFEAKRQFMTAADA